MRAFAGKAEVTYTDGSHYDGYFYRGLREGRGLYTFPDGQQYSGRFLADSIDVNAPGSIVIPRPVRVSQDHWMIPLNASLLDDLEKVHGRAGFSQAEAFVPTEGLAYQTGGGGSQVPTISLPS